MPALRMGMHEKQRLLARTQHQRRKKPPWIISPTYQELSPYGAIHESKQRLLRQQEDIRRGKRKKRKRFDSVVAKAINRKRMNHNDEDSDTEQPEDRLSKDQILALKAEFDRLDANSNGWVSTVELSEIFMKFCGYHLAPHELAKKVPISHTL